MSSVIWWIRRDLRLSDNPTLAAALDRSESVVPLFILDPKLLKSSYGSARRTAFLFDGLRALDLGLRQRGSALIVREGDPLAVLQMLREEIAPVEIFAEADYSPYARNRDTQVANELPLTLINGLTVQPPEVLHKADGNPYTIYTPFSKMWRNHPTPGKPLPAPDHLPSVPDLEYKNVPIPTTNTIESSFSAGEAEALSRLANFCEDSIQHYTFNRNRMDLDGTSKLSPYLRFGMISARQAVWAAHMAQIGSMVTIDREGAQTWLDELIWREFYITILYNFPYVRRMAFRPSMRAIPWRNDPEEYAAWTEGCTGYPIVDAAMRQLSQTGWMHNRARMITASFLTKDLLLDWKLGERYFMNHLLDGDPASNNGGWQWTAGTGTDAAPYFRVFNPVLQGLKFDPNGDYIRRWVPELTNVPTAFIHTPWKMPDDTQRRVGCVIGKIYPVPIVDHAMARQRVLDAYKQGEKT
jgi:deoxyribodipyrimidine photo-lyase